MIYTNGTPVWVVPIRYWEEHDNPQPGHIVGDQNPSESGHLYIFSDEYGHNVYVKEDRVFLLKDMAISVGRIKTQLKNDKEENELEQLIEKIRSKLRL